MFVRVLEPSTMPPDARLAELANILALGYLRHIFRQKESNSLELGRRSTAPVVSEAVGNGAGSRKETA